MKVDCDETMIFQLRRRPGDDLESAVRGPKVLMPLPEDGIDLPEEPSVEGIAVYQQMIRGRAAIRHNVARIASTDDSPLVRDYLQGRMQLALIADLVRSFAGKLTERDHPGASYQAIALLNAAPRGYEAAARLLDPDVPDETIEEAVIAACDAVYRNPEEAFPHSDRPIAFYCEHGLFIESDEPVARPLRESSDQEIEDAMECAIRGSLRRSPETPQGSLYHIAAYTANQPGQYIAAHGAEMYGSMALNVQSTSSAVQPLLHRESIGALAVRGRRIPGALKTDVLTALFAAAKPFKEAAASRESA